MKIIALMLIGIIIPLTSFPASIKAAPGSSGGGGGFVGGGSTIGSGYRNGGGGSGFMVGGEGYKNRDTSSGYKGAAKPGKPVGGGDPGAAIVILPKPIVDAAPKVPMPKECKEEVKDCISKHVYGDAGEPEFGGPCCAKLKTSKSCGCKFLTSDNPKLKKAANDVLRGCHFKRPICIQAPMPRACRQEVRNCINTHIFGGAGAPRYGEACCLKFKDSKSCMCNFHTSKDPRLSRAANGVLRGCHFRKPDCSN